MVRFFGNLVAIFLFATAANAQAQVTLTMDHLELSALIHIMRTEGLEYAATLNKLGNKKTKYGKMDDGLSFTGLPIA